MNYIAVSTSVQNVLGKSSFVDQKKISPKAYRFYFNDGHLKNRH